MPSRRSRCSRAGCSAAEKTGKEVSAGLRALGDGINKIDVVQVADLGSRLQAINTSLSGLATRINR